MLYRLTGYNHNEDEYEDMGEHSLENLRKVLAKHGLDEEQIEELRHTKLLELDGVISYTYEIDEIKEAT